MIKSLSPYYLYTPFVSPLSGLTSTAYELRIDVWTGDKGSPPASPVYTKTIPNPTGSTGNSKVNIARLVNDFINFTPFDTLATELIDGVNQYWVRTSILYYTADEDDFVPQFITTTLMVKGYGYGMVGENSQPPTNRIMLEGTEFKVSRDGFFILPIRILETP